jgi:hypothetical protein
MCHHHCAVYEMCASGFFRFTMRTVPVAGIDSFIIRDIAFKLRHDPNLSILSTKTIHLLQKGVDLVNHEMLIIFHEIEYWRGIAQATPLQKHITNLFHQGPIHFLTTLRSYFFDNHYHLSSTSLSSVLPSSSSASSQQQSIFMISELNSYQQKDQLIDLRLSILQNKFYSLGILLNILYQSGTEIRSILLIYEKLWCDHHTIREYSPDHDESCYSLNELTGELYHTFKLKSTKILEKCLNLIIEMFGNDTFVRRGGGGGGTGTGVGEEERGDERQKGNEERRIVMGLVDERQLQIQEISELAEKCVREAEVDQQFPPSLHPPLSSPSLIPLS